jgi:hypothetical protein
VAAEAAAVDLVALAEVVSAGVAAAEAGNFNTYRWK